jgi:FMN phosphatase YigB (HAD superfamily)
MHQAGRSFISVKVNFADFSAVVSDIDYTLVDFGKGHRASIKALAQFAGRQFADEVNRMFYLVLEGLRRGENVDWNERSAFQEVISQMQRLQAPALTTYGLKPWSRESWMILVAKKLQIVLTPEQVEAGRDLYWNTVGENIALYNDAQAFLEALQQVGIPLILMTSSDSICRVAGNYAVLYDPTYSEQYKRGRLKRLPLSYQELVIGDPIDKPDPRFFDKVFQKVAQYGDFPMGKILVIGDSERSDLQEPRRRGCTTFLVTR